MLKYKLKKKTLKEVSFLREEKLIMNVIKVKPNEKGEIFIKLYGTTYQIVVEKTPKDKK